ncbi:MAG: type VI secretion system-associated FHA domain protein TagH [Candidatus Competibacteraceae bacterium]|nr:MAG: type VI secretion system-associated FHA domain protein TagH [Candidatus Competibacteraceae bacterium]
MPLRLTITSFQRLSPGQETTKTLDRGSISIGRAAQSDWVLQDPERILSGRHCTLHYQDGGYFLTDTSTNGVYLNDSEQRVGRNQMVRLKDGDHFVLGEYEIAVALLSEAAEPAKIQPEGPITEAVPISDLMPASGTAELGGGPDSMIKPSFGDIMTEGRDGLGLRQAPGKPGKAAVVTEPPSDLMEPERASFEPPALIPETPPSPIPEITPPPFEPGSEPTDEPSAAQAEMEPPAQPFPDILAPPPEAPPEIPPVAGERPGESAEPLIPEDWWSTPSPAAQPAPPPVQPPARSVPEIPAPPPVQPPARPVPEIPAPPPVQPPARPARPEPRPTAQPTGPDIDVLIRAFLEGADLPHLQLTAEQLPDCMRTLGEIFRETVQGLVEVLLARGDVKGEFRLHRTTIGPIENNPLKTSPGQPPLSPEQVMTLLLVRQKDAYMSPVQAVREGFNDIKAHQLAVMAGIQAALARLLERFDPGNLETRLEQSVLDNLWPGNRKAKYWDLFTTEYRTIAREAEDDFNELFGDEFARAYEERLGEH